MPMTMKGKTYYRTAEVCQTVGIGRSTLLRWLRNGVISDVSSRDRRGWRLFTPAEVKRIEDEANHIEKGR
jgi:excisionase family DNA binding protein